IEDMRKESRIGRITSKRQLTIPKDFYEKLNLGKDVEIILEKDGLKIRKLRRIEESFDDYSDLVLQSVLEDGFTSKDEILNEFRARINIMPLAVQKLLSEAREYAKNDPRTSEELDKELFGED
ncbi:MAG: AbrB/MazE/SpoVT family DNA-binding domain-containing protein, partial [Syntrophomonadaceae bacterium]|nr:AbrB/MazE/SpoVT family DNA-binding domain-containing protein [Syntrophomonadaceae bacterium]